jgi:hypothetical protein
VPDPAFPDDRIPANRTLLLHMIADIGTNRFEYIYDFGVSGRATPRGQGLRRAWRRNDRLAG